MVAKWEKEAGEEFSGRQRVVDGSKGRRDGPRGQRRQLHHTLFVAMRINCGMKDYRQLLRHLVHGQNVTLSPQDGCS